MGMGVRKRAPRNHGLSRHPLYRVWAGMRERCYNPGSDSFQWYGARGVSVSDEWRFDFKRFYEDMISGYRKGLQLDRIDSDGKYCRENCRWVTPKQNAATRRKGNQFKKGILK